MKRCFRSVHYLLNDKIRSWVENVRSMTWCAAGTRRLCLGSCWLLSHGTLVLNVGGKADVKVGDHLVLCRVVREVRDATTGKVIRKFQDKVGEVVITDVDENSSIGTYTGASPAKVGDTVASTP